MTILTKSRIEYLRYGVNWRRGCSHGCRYCYMHGAAKRFDQLMPESGEWTDPEARIESPMDALIDELSAKSTLPTGPIMLSTSHDPAMDEECAQEAADLIAALAGFDLLDQTLMLTKAPNRALDALRGIGHQDGLRFGTSFTSMGIWLTRTYEPRAELPSARLHALARAHHHGYRTWVSLEPPLPDVYLVKLVELVLTLEARPWIVLGKLNARGVGDEDLHRWAQSDHWGRDRDRAVNMLEAHGYTESLSPIDAGYWIKEELRTW